MIKRIFIAFALSCAPLVSSADVCATSWDADKIISETGGHSSYFRIPLKDKNQASNEVTLGQVRAFHEAKERISRASGISPIFLICDDSAPNAFAAPTPKGAVVAITLGMLRMVDGDSDMAAAVIGHEFAHHVKGHGAASKIRNTAIGLVGLIAGVALEYNIQKNYDIAGIGRDLANIGSSLVSRKFDRDQEREADDLGFQYMLSAGFNPNGSIKLAELFSRHGHGGGGFFNSHPGWDERGELFRTKIAQSPEAQQIIARASATPRATDSSTEGISGQVVAFAPSYQASEAQKGYQAGFSAYQEGKYSKALDELKSAANAGYPPAQGFLGYLYEKGQGTQINIPEAISWYRKAADQEEPNALLMLGSLYERGVGVPQSDSDAFALYKKASDLNLPVGMVALGSMYERGKGTRKSTTKAFDLYRKASNASYAGGHFELSRVYRAGIGIEKNLTEAENLLRRAADMGNEQAQVALGSQYMQGTDGLSKKPEEALFWFKKASEKGYPPAIYHMGAAYETGFGVNKNVDTAKGYYTKAAKSGLKDAEVALSRLKSANDLHRSNKRGVDATDRPTERVIAKNNPKEARSEEPPVNKKDEEQLSKVKITTTANVFKDCADCPEMVEIPVGDFEMGSNFGEANERPAHRVTISQIFALGKTEVTQGQWRAIMGNNPSYFDSCGDDCPVVNVRWKDVQEFIQKLNDKTGKQYRLPSEAEWEYACRAGGQHLYCGSDNENNIAWYGAYERGNSSKTINPVGRKQPNAFGLYDMSGNVWERVADSYHSSYEGAPSDGSAWQGDGTKRLLRGGAWSSIPQGLRAIGRSDVSPLSSDNDDGFRLAKTLP